MSLKFRIEQVALCPNDPVAARELLEAMGIGPWTDDTVAATGTVGGWAASNTANLAFNYSAMSGNELELLYYTRGDNWMAGHEGRVSHIGMHCTEEELTQWTEFFSARNIPVAQEVRTDSHTNPAIKDSRRYHYVIFDTRAILGVDVKFIVRRNIGPGVAQ